MKSKKLWSIEAPIVSDFARLLTLWVDRPCERCPKCRASLSMPANVIDVEWDEGSDQIGDFIFASLGPLVLKSEVADELLARFKGFAKGEVHMRDHPNLHRPARVTKRTPKRVWLPYDGPELCVIVYRVELAPSGRSW